jgi:hypothetical protein
MSTPVSMKPGASITGVSPEMAFGMVIISGVFQSRGVPCVITAGTDGKHGVGSLHYIGSAVDIRLPSRFTSTIESDGAMRRDLELALGEEWDVVLEVDHLHVEWDPKKSNRRTQAT